MTAEQRFGKFKYKSEGALQRDRRRRLALAWSLVFGTPVIGAFLGGRIGYQDGIENNAENLRAAVGYERCLDYVEEQNRRGSKSVPLASLPENIVSDCGISDIMDGVNLQLGDVGNTAVKQRDLDGTVTIEKEASLMYTFPSAQDLNDEAAWQRRQGSVNEFGEPLGGMVLGAIAGLAVGIAELNAIVLYWRHKATKAANPIDQHAAFVDNRGERVV